MSEKTYHRLLELGITLVKAGFAVVLDAKYDSSGPAAAGSGARLRSPIFLWIFIHCTAPKEVLEARLDARSGDIADATVAVLRQQRLDPLTDSEQAVAQTIDTTKDVVSANSGYSLRHRVQATA